MNLDELQSVQSRERQTDSLQQLRISFYEDAAAFIQDLREQRQRAAEKADDPFDSPDVNRLTDDIRTAEQTVEAIYERRVGKVVKMASLAAADMPTEQEGLTKEERALFETMVAAIEDHRGRILDVIGGDAPAGSVASSGADHEVEEAAAATSPGDDERVDAAAVMGEDSGADAVADVDGTRDAESEPVPETEPVAETKTASDDADPTDGGPGDGTGTSDGSELRETDAETTAPGEADRVDSDHEQAETDGSKPNDTAATDATSTERVDDERVTVRITEDVGEIFGVDEREYDLASDDVVTLPVTNAEPLIDRDAAEPLE